MTASYGIGSYLAATTGDSVQLIYKGETFLSSQYSTPVRVGDYLFASEGRADGGPTSLKCIDPKTKKVLWDTPSNGVANLLAVGEQVLAITDQGEMLVFDAKPDKFALRSSGRAPAGLYRALPAISRGTLVLRNSAPGGGSILAFR